MGRNYMKEIFRAIAGLSFILLSSCMINPNSDLNLASIQLITFNLDGTDIYSFPSGYQGYDCSYGYVVPMHDNHRFIVSNENLFIMDSESHEIEVF